METQEPKTYNIYYDQISGIVVMEWKGYATSRQFRDGTELMLDSLIRNKATKVLADAKEMVLIGMEDQHWMEFYFLPKAIRSGLEACAIIIPDSYFNKVAIESINSKIDQKILQVKVFENASEAKDWLTEA